MPTVDIIIPAHNAAHFLPRTLDSVIAQTFTDWRILLVDDGSQDRTAEVVEPYRERLGEKLLYIHKENGGVAAARNTAIEHATAEYLALLDADDVWLPRRLEATLIPFPNRPEVGLVYGFVTRIDAEDRLLDTFATRNPHGEGEVARYIYMRTLDLPCPTLTFRRRCVEEVGGFDETMRATEDRDLWLRIAQRYQVALAPEIVAYYRVSPQSMTTETDRMFFAQQRFLDKHRGTAGCGAWEYRVALSWTYRQQAEALSDRGEHRKALRSALRALLWYPFNLLTVKASAAVLIRSLGLRTGRRLDPTR